MFEYDAFISYSSFDRKKVEQLQYFLQTYQVQGKPKLRIYLDKTDLATKQLWGEISAALSASRRLIVAITKNSNQNQNVHKEISLYKKLNPDGEIIVVLLSGKVTLIPDILAGQKFADLRRSLYLSWLRPNLRQELLRLFASISDMKLRDLIPWDKQRRQAQYRFAGTTTFLFIFAVGLLFNQQRLQKQAAYADQLYAEARSQSFFADQLPIAIAFLQGSDSLSKRADIKRILARLADYLEFEAPNNTASASPYFIHRLDNRYQLGSNTSTILEDLPVRGIVNSAMWNEVNNILGLTTDDGQLILFSTKPLRVIGSYQVYEKGFEEILRFSGDEGLSITCLNSTEKIVVNYSERQGSSAGMVTPVKKIINVEKKTANLVEEDFKPDNCNKNEISIKDVGYYNLTIPFEVLPVSERPTFTTLKIWQNKEMLVPASNDFFKIVDQELWQSYMKSIGFPADEEQGSKGDTYAPEISNAFEIKPVHQSCDPSAQYLHILEGDGRAALHHLVRLKQTLKGPSYDKKYTVSFFGDNNFSFAVIPNCKFIELPSMTIVDLKTLDSLGLLPQIGWFSDFAFSDEKLIVRSDQGSIFELPFSLLARDVDPEKPQPIPKSFAQVSIETSNKNALFMLSEDLYIATTTGYRISLFNRTGKVLWTSLPNERFRSLKGGILRTPSSIIVATSDSWMEIDAVTGFPLAGWQILADPDEYSQITQLSRFSNDGFVVTRTDGTMYQFKSTKPDGGNKEKHGRGLPVPYKVEGGEMKRSWPLTQ